MSIDYRRPERTSPAPEREPRVFIPTQGDPLPRNLPVGTWVILAGRPFPVSGRTTRRVGHRKPVPR